MRMRKLALRRLLAGSLAALLAAGIFGPAVPRAGAANLWPVWQAHEEDAARQIDHGRWAALLEKYLTPRKKGPNLVDYAALKDNEPDRAALAAYVADLEGVTVSRLNRNEQYAYWVNLYNALTVKVVLAHYPVESIRDIDISPGLFADGPWQAKLLTIEGREVSLDDIEHRILRPIWQDPRTHYVLNCAAMGCPELLARPLDPARLDSQLDRAARAYIGGSRGAAFSPDGTLTVSSIYDWYAEDFGGGEQAIIDHLASFAGAQKAARLKQHGRIDEYAYDWSLNGIGGQGGKEN